MRSGRLACCKAEAETGEKTHFGGHNLTFYFQNGCTFYYWISDMKTKGVDGIHPYGDDI